MAAHKMLPLIPTLSSKEKVDRLVVLLSGERIMKLLGVPLLPNETGETQAAAVSRPTLWRSGTFSNAPDVCPLTQLQVTPVAKQEPVFFLSRISTKIL